MIISYSHNFIYFRTKKTGSSTIQEILKDSCEAQDLYTGAQTEDMRAHIKAAEVIEMVPQRFWRESFKFTSERHPYEKAVSFAYYRFGKRQKKGAPLPGDFEKYLDQVVRRGGYRSVDYYTVSGKVVVDDFIRCESLGADLKRIGERLGIPIPEELPRKKSTSRLDARPAREILSEEQKRIIFEGCQQEFKLLGYEP
jgi:hypothetical protein